MARMICLLFIVLTIGCTNNDIIRKFDCSISDLAIALVSKTNAIGCAGSDGKLIVSASLGKAPYEYSLNGGAFQTIPEFNKLGSGNYSIQAKDANGCIKEISVTIDAANSNLDASVVIIKNSQCTSPNGNVTITGTGGTPPYSYLFGTGVFTATNVFPNLKAGTYNAIIKDANDCQKSLGIVVGRENTGVSLSGQIKPIIDTHCAIPGCHVSGGQSPNLSQLQGVQSSASSIKTRTGNRTMPIGAGGTLTQTQIDLIACWVDDGALNN